MSPEAQRIAIAEACGYRRVECPNSSLAGGDPQQPEPMTYWREVEIWGTDPVIGVPGYLTDLNAMHEAEKVLIERDEWANYERTLTKRHLYPIRATAAQRAEAFLRTLGKWTDA